jgi:hypothetical protein
MLFYCMLAFCVVFAIISQLCVVQIPIRATASSLIPFFCPPSVGIAPVQYPQEIPKNWSSPVTLFADTPREATLHAVVAAATEPH